MVLKTPNVVKSFMKNHAPCALYSKKSRFTNANASDPLMSDAGNSVQRRATFTTSNLQRPFRTAPIYATYRRASGMFITWSAFVFSSGCRNPSGHSGFSRCGISKIVYGLQSVAV